MLYENTVKIVPLKKEEGNIVLKNPFNIRIRHPEAQLLIPLHLDDKVSDGTIAVFYQQQVHNNKAVQPSVSLKLKRYYLSMEEKELKS